MAMKTPFAVLLAALSIPLFAQVQQTSSGANSPNVANVQGNVSINPAAAAPVVKEIAKADSLELENTALQIVLNQKTMESLSRDFGELNKQNQELQGAYKVKTADVCAALGVKPAQSDCAVSKDATSKWTAKITPKQKQGTQPNGAQ